MCLLRGGSGEDEILSGRVGTEAIFKLEGRDYFGVGFLAFCVYVEGLVFRYQYVRF